METQTRHETDTVALQRTIEAQPARFAFMQVVRLLSRFVKETAQPLQFKVNPNMRFPTAEIEALQISEANTPEKQYTLLVNFMGLIGQAGIMPADISDRVLERLQAKDDTLLEFLNIFHHHLLALYVELRSARQFAINHERAQNDVTLDTLAHITGQSSAVNDDTRLYHAGLLAQQSRSAEGLMQFLTSYFDLPIRISQYTPTWMALDESDTSIIGGEHAQQSVLGENATLGKRIWHVQNQFTVWVGPLALAQFLKFLPKGRYLQQLNKRVREYIGLEHDYTVKLLLKAEDIPRAELRYKTPEKLGFTTWLQTATFSVNHAVVTLTTPEAEGDNHD